MSDCSCNGAPECITSLAQASRDLIDVCVAHSNGTQQSMKYRGLWGTDATVTIPQQLAGTLYSGVDPSNGLLVKYTVQSGDTISIGLCQIPAAVTTAAATVQLQKTCYKFSLSALLDFVSGSAAATVETTSPYTPTVGDVIIDPNLPTGTTVVSVTPGLLNPTTLTLDPTTIMLSAPWTGAAAVTNTVTANHIGAIYLEINPATAPGGPIIQLGYYADPTSGGPLNAPIPSFNPALIASCKPPKSPCIPLAPVGWA